MNIQSSSDSERVALVTGAGRPNGLGAAIVRELALRGVKVVVADVLNETWNKPELPNEPAVDFVEADFQFQYDVASFLQYYSDKFVICIYN